MLKAKLSKIIYTLCILSAMFAVAIMSEEVMACVKKSIILCFSSVIPAVFPFMVLSSLFVSACSGYSFGPTGKIVSRIFGISPCAVSALICGMLCGYPIGARCTMQLFRQKKITASEAESLIAYSNNSGPLFVIGSIGAGMLGSVKYGVILYIIQLISAFTAALILRKQTFTNPFSIAGASSKKIDLTSAICDSVKGILNVCGFVVFFGAIAAMAKPLIDILPDIAASILSCVIEITNGASYISSTLFQTGEKIILISFALGWSGMSVHMQVKSIVSSSGISMRRYYGTRIFMSLLSMIIAYIVIYCRDSLFLVLLNNRWLLFCIGALSVFCIKKERKPPYRKSPLL